MRVYLLISWFDSAGGSEEPLTVLAIELKKLRHEVFVITQQPAKDDNQYVRRLRENQVPVISWPENIVKLTSDWMYQDEVVRKIVKVSSPGLTLLALLAAGISRKTLSQAFQSVLGRWQNIVSAIIHKDRSEGLMKATLDFLSFWRRPDIIHVFRSELPYVFSWSEQKGFPSIYSELGIPGEIASREYFVGRSVYLNKATVVTAISKATEEGLRKVMIKRPVIIVPPVYTMLPLVEDNLNSQSNRQLTITCVARLSSEKGIQYLIESAKVVLKTHNQVRFLIAGGGPLKEELIQLAKQLEIQDNVQFYGTFAKEDLPKIMDVTDIFVLPSLTEGMGLAIIEAMAFGKPVVATRVGGVPEVVDADITGLLVPPKDPVRLADALVRLVDDDSLRKRLGASGRLKIEAGIFSTQTYISNNLAVYQRAIESDRSGSLLLCENDFHPYRGSGDTGNS